ncbi:MAG TPA: SPOR domain-containing protein [Burkholderiales bacterium]|nr:SPOR domain-containing protein [Burkholderiales bacterium]
MPKPSVSEEELQLRKRARRRLVGAIVLVLLVIVVVPMFLDHTEHKQPVQDIDVRIPPIPGQQTPPNPPAATPLAAPPAQQQPAAQPPPAPPAQAKPPSPAETEVAISPPVVPAPKPEPASASKPAAQTREGFVIQLGAYGKPASAKQLLQKLKAQKFPAYTEPVKTPQGTRTRVRAGPYPTMDAAEKARERLRELKLMPVSASDAKVVPMGE